MRPQKSFLAQRLRSALDPGARHVPALYVSHASLNAYDPVESASQPDYRSLLCDTLMAAQRLAL